MDLDSHYLELYVCKAACFFPFPPRGCPDLANTNVSRLETEHGIIVRFILGHTDDKEAEDKVALEAKETGDFIRLPIKVVQVF